MQEIKIDYNCCRYVFEVPHEYGYIEPLYVGEEKRLFGLLAKKRELSKKDHIFKAKSFDSLTAIAMKNALDAPNMTEPKKAKQYTFKGPQDLRYTFEVDDEFSDCQFRIVVTDGVPLLDLLRFSENYKVTLIKTIAPISITSPDNRAIGLGRALAFMAEHTPEKYLCKPAKNEG